MNVLEIVGNTPLLELSHIVPPAAHVRLLAKAEFLNSSGSVKDRAAKAMILEGIHSGALAKGKTIIDSTSGNTGIAYAMIGAAFGYRVELYMPSNVTEQRKCIMRAYGAAVVETPALEGMDGAYRACLGAVRAAPERYFFPDQFNNPANWRAHYSGTAEEIWAQTGGAVTHFVAGTGTAGTFMGCSLRLKERNPAVRCYTVTPDSPFHGIEGIRHYAMLLRDGFFDSSVADGRLEVATARAYEMARRLAQEEGVFAGISSGANVAAALELARSAPAGSVIVTILCDNGSRYLSSPVWQG